jgi:hypothetical protein
LYAGTPLRGLLDACFVFAKLNFVAIVAGQTETRIGDAGFILANMTCVALGVGLAYVDAFEMLVANLPSDAGLIVVTFCGVFYGVKVKA